MSEVCGKLCWGVVQNWTQTLNSKVVVGGGLCSSQCSALGKLLVKSEVLLLLPSEWNVAVGIQGAVEENKTKERQYD